MVAGLLVAWCGFIAYMTLTPVQPHHAADVALQHVLAVVTGHRSPSASTTGGVWERLANIALFLPYAALVALLLPRRRRWLAVVLTAAASCAIELTQAYWVTSRDASLRDVVENTLGGLLGWLLVAALPTRSWGRV